MSTPLAHQLTTNVKLLQKMVLISQDEVLLLLREPQAKSRPNCWDLPGGNSEWPGSITAFTRGLHQHDICREVQEETGIELAPAMITQPDLIFFDTTFEPQKSIYTILTGWRHRLVERPATIQLSPEHTQAEWVSLEKLSHYDFGFAEFIPQMIRLACQ